MIYGIVRAFENVSKDRAEILLVQILGAVLFPPVILLLIPFLIYWGFLSCKNCCCEVILSDEAHQIVAQRQNRRSRQNTAQVSA